MDGTETAKIRLDLSGDGLGRTDSSLQIEDYDSGNNVDLKYSGDEFAHCQNTSELNPEHVLKDMDAYLDDLNGRLTVLRMVHDSIIKGMISAVVEETNELITLKDKQILCLNEKLCRYEFAQRNIQVGSSAIEAGDEIAGQYKYSCSPESRAEQIHAKGLHDLSFATVKQTIEHLIHMCLMEVNSYFVSGGATPLAKAFEGLLLDNFSNLDYSKFDKIDTLKLFMESASEQVNRIFDLVEESISGHKWTYNLRKEFMPIIVNDFIVKMLNEFKMKLCQERMILFNYFSAKIEEVKHYLQEELDSMSRSLFNCELWHLSSHGSLEDTEETKTSNTKDNPFVLPSQGSKAGIESVDYLPHFSMTKEEVIAYYKTEITNMKRDHESALQEKTEELFSVKRELLRVKGFLSCRREERDHDTLRRRFTEMTSKLDFLVESWKLDMSEHNYERIPADRGNDYNMLSENLCLTGEPLTVACILENDVDGGSSPSIEAEFVQEIDKFGQDMRDVMIGTELRDDVQQTFLRCWFNEMKNQLELMDMEIKAIHDIYSTMLTGSLEESKSIINLMEVKHDEIKVLLESSLVQREVTLHSEHETTMKLKHDMQSLLKLIEEKEYYIKEAEHASLHQKKQLDETFQELSLLRSQNIKLEQLLSDAKDEICLKKSELDRSGDRVLQYEEKNAKLDGNLSVALNGLKESEIKIKVLETTIQQKESQVISAYAVERAQRENMKSLLLIVIQVSKLFEASEGSILEKIQRNIARLDTLEDQIRPLKQHACVLQGRVLSYKRNTEMKSSNLQKAEAEVDMLGDEIEALLNLLAKIYISLDRYSPILQHYPGVMEVLNLIKEVKGVSVSAVYFGPR